MVATQGLPDFIEPYAPLEAGPHPSLYIHEKSLALDMMKHPDIKPVDFMEFWQLFLDASENDFPDIDMYFDKTPVVLHGERQFETRRSLLPLYRRMEVALTSWIDDLTIHFLNGFEGNETISTLDFVDEYLDQVFKKMMADELGIEPDELPPLPGKFFRLIIRFDELLDYQTKLHLLRECIETQLSTKDEKERDELWGLLSIVVMGQDTLSGALLYFISRHHEIDSAEALFDQSRPVSILWRQIAENIRVQNLDLKKGQRVYISTGLFDENKTEAPIPFGVGVHLCPGKKISLILAEAFMRAWKNFPQLHGRMSEIKFLRDTVLKAKEMS
jgi:hypothetical protein